MDEIVAKVFHAVHAMWRRRWIALAVAWGTAILGGILVMSLHDRYQATARVYVDTQTVLKPLMTGLAVQPDIDQQVNMLARTLISRPNVERLLDSPTIGLLRPTEQTRDRAIDALIASIKVAPVGANLYSISYRDTDPQRAQRLVKGLVEMFVDTGIGENRRDSEEARRFIDEQIHSYEVKLTDSENRLKDFKLRNFGLTGTSNQDYFTRVSTLSDAVSKLRIDLSAAEQARDAFKRELSNEDPQLPFDVTANGQPAPPSEIDVRIDAQKKLLDDLLRRYTDEHPDVIGTRRTIAMLERQKKQQQEADARSGKPRGNAATSPVYQKIRVSLAEAEANVASLRTQLAEQESRLNQTRATAGKVPEVEAELAQLNRDYDILRKNYDELVARRESASLGVKIDQSAQLADFRIIEPPRVSPKPVFPNRMMLAAFTLIASIAAGMTVAFGLGQAFPSFHAPKDLRELTGRPVLGSVSMHVDAAMKVRQRRDLIAFASIGTLLVVLHFVWIALLAMRAASRV